jgi:hypothetical protein
MGCCGPLLMDLPVSGESYWWLTLLLTTVPKEELFSKILHRAM